MKRKITKAEWEALSPEMKLMYVAGEGDTYILPLTDYVDPQPLINARDREKEDARVLREQLATATTELESLRKATPKDVQTLTSAHNQAIAELKATFEPRITTLRSELEKALISQTAREIADSVTATPQNASIMLLHTTAKLAVDWNGDVPTVKVKKADGTLGDAYNETTAPAVKKDFVDNPTFAAIVVKSKASGGGAAGTTPSPDSGSAGKKWADYTPVERVALSKADPAAFKALSDANNAERAASRPTVVRKNFF